MFLKYVVFTLVFLSVENAGASSYLVERRAQQNVQMAPVDYGYTQNVYQDIFDAFISDDPIADEIRDRLSNEYHLSLVDTKGNSEQIRQKTFLLALLREGYTSAYYKKGCEGCSYADDDITKRKTLRGRVDYKGVNNEKTLFFKQLLEIDEAQDLSTSGDRLQQVIGRIISGVQATYKPILQEWVDAIQEEKAYKVYVRQELQTATAANLATKPYNRAIPFFKFLAFPLFLCFMEFLMLEESSVKTVTIQQNHTMPYSEIETFMKGSPSYLLSAPYCFPHSNNCTFALYYMQEGKGINAYKVYAVPLIAVIFSVIVYGQQIWHECAYFIFKKCYGKNIEGVDDDIVTIIFNETKNMPTDDAKIVIARIKEFLPSLLKKRTWGFHQELRERMKQIKQ